MKKIFALCFALSLFAQTIKVQLNWEAQFEFASFYMAKEKGYYKEAGLDVEILPQDLSHMVDLKNALKNKKADVIVGYSYFLTDAINSDRYKVLSYLLNSSPTIAYGKIPIEDAKHGCLYINKNELNNFVTLLYKKMGGECIKDFSIKDFKKDPYGIISVYRSNISYIDFETSELYLIDPRRYNYDFYEDLLITTTPYYKKHKQELRKFVLATLKGWRYALTHIDESVNILLKKYAKNRTKEQLLYEANSIKINSVAALEKLGLFERNRLKDMILVYAQNSFLKEQKDIYDFIDPMFIDTIPSLNFQDREKLASKTLAYSETNWPPFSIMKEGHLEGIGVDFLKLVSKKSGFDFRYVPKKSWSDVLKAVKNHTLDMAMITAPTKDRLKYAVFSNPYDTFDIAIATKRSDMINSPKELSGKTIAVGKDYTAQKILKRYYKDIKLKTVNNTYEGFKLLEEGKVYGVADILPILTYIISSKNYTDTAISTTLNHDVELAAMFRDDFEDFKQIFDKVLDNITDDEKREIYQKYSPKVLIKSVNKEERQTYMSVFAGLLLLVIMMILHLYRYKKDINKKIKLESELNTVLEVVDDYVLMSKTDKEGRIVHISKALERFLGYTKEEMLGTTHYMLKPKAESEFYKKVWQTVQKGDVFTFEHIKNYKKYNKEYFAKGKIYPLKDQNNDIEGYFIIEEDITPLKIVSELAHVDELTGLYNRRFLYEVVKKELANLKRTGGVLFFAVYDLDNFKLYNDNYGHVKGDMILQSVSRAVRFVCKRESDYLFRIGGEEFAILAKMDSSKHVKAFAKKIVKSVYDLGLKHEFNQPYGVVTVSLGAIGYEIEKSADISFDTVYKMADELMYKVKQKGKNDAFVQICSTKTL